MLALLQIVMPLHCLQGHTACCVAAHEGANILQLSALAHIDQGCLPRVAGMDEGGAEPKQHGTGAGAALALPMTSTCGL